LILKAQNSSSLTVSQAGARQDECNELV